MSLSLPRAIALAVSLALGGCDLSSVNTSIASESSQNLPALCALGASAHQAFAAIATTGELSSAAVADETAAYAGLTSLCANPPADLGGALVQAAAIYATIVASLHTAQAAS